MPNKGDKLFDGDLPQNIHASSVAYAGRAVLIIGPSGSGKSSLALQLLAVGSRLIADDRTILSAESGKIVASAPEQIKGLIEARGIGLLKTEYAGSTPVALVVDLEHEEKERLPKLRTLDLAGNAISIWSAVRAPHFPAAILQYLKHGLLDT